MKDYNGKDTSSYLLIIISSCVRGRVFVFTYIHREGFICLVQLGCHGTDQRCCVEDVSFLCQVPLSLLQNEAPHLSNQPFTLFTHQKRAEPQLSQCVCDSLSKHKAVIYHYQALPSCYIVSRFISGFRHSRKGSQSNYKRLKQL